MYTAFQSNSSHFLRFLHFCTRNQGSYPSRFIKMHRDSAEGFCSRSPPGVGPQTSNSRLGVCSLPGLQVLVIRLRDSLIKMGEELSQAAAAESQQRENSQYYQRRLEELKADMEELVQREAEASRRCMELVSAVLGPGFRRGALLLSDEGPQAQASRDLL